MLIRNTGALECGAHCTPAVAVHTSEANDADVSAWWRILTAHVGYVTASDYSRTPKTHPKAVPIACGGRVRLVVRHGDVTAHAQRTTHAAATRGRRSPPAARARPACVTARSPSAAGRPAPAGDARLFSDPRTSSAGVRTRRGCGCCGLRDVRPIRGRARPVLDVRTLF
ncbi:unnamed protein product [Chrysodeixis includens]|uniref:Uncharacterized protein n=1 Tax=Chrysodeixis includens TaxID=689277 RepID=A0A9N8L2A8_CHRIL|nr:unnamed protein product [Chrysodeixis includens]